MLHVSCCTFVVLLDSHESAHGKIDSAHENVHASVLGQFHMPYFHTFNGWKRRKGPIPTPSQGLSALLRKWHVLLRAVFVLTKDPNFPSEGRVCGKLDREGSCSKVSGGFLSKDKNGP